MAILIKEDENILFSGFVVAKGECMTEDFIPLKAEIIFEKPNIKREKLILIKENPSDIKEYSNSFVSLLGLSKRKKRKSLKTKKVLFFILFLLRKLNF